MMKLTTLQSRGYTLPEEIRYALNLPETAVITVTIKHNRILVGAKVN